MPTRPKRPCSHPGCPRLTDERYCPDHARLDEAQYNKYDRDPDTKRRYGAAWTRIRTAYLAAHPLCAECLREGRATPTQEVHHVLPLSRGGTHDPDNLLGLCKPCHSRVTALEGGRWRRRSSG